MGPATRRSVLVALLAVLVACSGGGSSTPAGSQTPKITVASSGPLGDGLLTSADLQAIAGLPRDAVVVPITDLSVFADPDPRGPCGAKLPADVAGGAGIGIQSTAVQGAELISSTDEAAAKSSLDRRIADAHAGCPEFQTTTNRGELQKVKLDKVISLGTAADEGLATQQAILVGDKVTSVTFIALRRSGAVVTLVLFAATPLTEETVQALAVRAADDLARVG